MSFILDALKKSENERKRQIGPSFAEVRVRRRNDERPLWAIAIGGLLAVNLAVLAIVLLRNTDPQPVPAPPGNAASAAAANPPVAVAESAPHPGRAPTESPAPSPAVRSLAVEAAPYDTDAMAEFDYPSLSAAAAVPEGPPIVRRIQPPSVTGATQDVQDFGPGADPLAGSAEDTMPTVNDIVARGTQLPDMHLDIHVYSGDPAERFVFVNMRKYTEGQPLNEGPRIERITTNGVILNHRGLRFLLPRQ